MKNRKVIIFSAPSAAGKTTIVKHLIEKFACLDFSISATTRAPRPHETHGKDYYFLSLTDFEAQVSQGAFIEHEQVYQGLFYGTLHSEIERIWSEGRIVLFDIDVEGGLNLKRYFGETALAVFVMPPSLEVLEQRLRNRNTESPERLQERLQKAHYELTKVDDFDVVLVNDQLTVALEEAETLVANFLEIPTHHPTERS
jgi:guanylate kinase